VQRQPSRDVRLEVSRSRSGIEMHRFWTLGISPPRLLSSIYSVRMRLLGYEKRGTVEGLVMPLMILKMAVAVCC